MLAKVNGLFRLTRDGELKYSQSGSPILKLGIACSEKYKDKETQLFLDATVFGKPAEIINQYAGTKGTQIYLSGKLQTEQWQDQQGQKKSKVSMTVEGFDFVSNGGGNNQQAPQPQQEQQRQQSYQAPQPQYENKQGRPVTQDTYNSNQQRQMPNQPPEIDIDSDIPF